MTAKNINLELYNQSYSKYTPGYLADYSSQIKKSSSENSQSLIQFLDQYFQDQGGLSTLYDKKILELGCGLGGLSQFLSQYTRQMTSVDISPLAIDAAKTLVSNSAHIDFQCFDVCGNVSLSDRFDFIIDSHLLHCITDQRQRENYFHFINNHLTENGTFLCETMTYNEHIQEPLGYDFAQDNILYKEINGESFPIRSIKESFELEQEILNSNLKIKTFFYHSELSINIFPEIINYPEFRLPKLIRLSAQRA